MNVATTTGRRLGWRGATALLLVPLLLAGGVLAGLWRFDANLHRVQAAVVNHDKMVTVNGQVVPLGRQLSAALVDSKRDQNFTWVLADDAHAASGLASGQYAAVVTIPENFSAAATSYAGDADAAHQATISISTSPVAGLAETALGQSVADAAAQSINQLLTETYLDNIYIGFNTMGEQFATAADGAGQLADGSTKLTDGLGQAADGGALLKEGGAPLAGGASQLADGLAQMADQTSALPGGVQQLADGAAQAAAAGPQITGGASQLASGASQWADGMGAFSTGLKQYTDGVDTYVGGINSLVGAIEPVVQALPDLTSLMDSLDPIMADLPERAVVLNQQVQAAVAQIRDFIADADALRAAADQTVAQLGSYRGTVDAVASGATTVACPESLKDTPGGCEAFAQGVRSGGQVASEGLSAVDSATLASSADALVDARPEILAALDKISAASTWFAGNADSIQAQWNTLRQQVPPGTSPNQALLTQLETLKSGGNQLIAAGAQLNAGAGQLDDGARALASGASTFASELTKYTDGIAQLSDGLGQVAGKLPALVDGIAQSASGARQLSSGVAQYTDGTGKLVDGIASAASGSQKVSDGMTQLADGLAEGADKIPSYDAAERKNLATVVASPIDTDPLGSMVTPGVAAVSLLLVLALWVGALAAYTIIRPVDPRNAASSSTTVHLVLRALLPGALLASVEALLLGVLGSVVLGLEPARGAALVGVLLVAGLTFAAVNHALAAWGGVWGRLASGAMLLVTSVTALTYSAPGIFGALRPLSPLSPALDAARAAMTWQAGALMVVTLLGWLAVGLIAGSYRIARSRTVSVRTLALAG